MLNDFALDFIVRSDHQLWSSSLYLGMVGGAFSALVSRSTGLMTRAPYFLGNAIIVFVAALSMALLIPSTATVEGGTVWVFVACWALAQAACGFFLWRLAMARSRDAYGHAKAAVVAFIPLINVWLMAVPSREEVRDVRPFWQRLGFVYVLAGLGVLGWGHFATGKLVERFKVAAIEEGALPVDLELQYLVNKDGLEKTLEFLTHTLKLPARINDALVLFDHEAEGDTYRKFFVVDAETLPAGFDLAGSVSKRLCADQGDIVLLRAGAVLEEAYYSRNGDPLRKVAVTAEDCGL
ncbi:hypothetical protein [Pleomorphomonas sp. PLEO]|uniref:hypothetical protein n=1 Tax=Pleomorphomonas sp. PLEO TaxID=3239306 RepID=UPI00351F7D87